MHEQALSNIATIRTQTPRQELVVSRVLYGDALAGPVISVTSSAQSVTASTHAPIVLVCVALEPFVFHDAWHD